MLSRLIGALLLLRSIALVVILALLLHFVTQLLSGMDTRVEALNAQMAGVQEGLRELGGGAEPGGLLRLSDSANESATFMQNLPDFELDIQPLSVNLGIVGTVEIPIPFADELNTFSEDFNNLVRQLESGFSALGDVSEQLHDITIDLRDTADEIEGTTAQLNQTVTSLGWILLAFIGLVALWLVTTVLDDTVRGWRMLRGPAQPS